MTAPVGIRSLIHPGDERDQSVTHHARTVAVCLVAVVLAFHYSLSTLLRSLQVDTPLAAVAAGTAAVGPTVTDRRITVPGAGPATAVTTYEPGTAGSSTPTESRTS